MSAIAQRYAAALADAVFQSKDAAKIRQDLADFVQAAGQSADLRNLLATPAIGPDKKKAVVAELAAKMGSHAEVRNFFFVLIDHGRTGILGEIRQSFEAEMNSRMGIADAMVASAHELSAEEKSRLTQTLEKITQKKIQAQYRLEPSLIGGTTVRIGSTIYNGSVRERLNRLRTRLESQ